VALCAVGTVVAAGHRVEIGGTASAELADLRRQLDALRSRRDELRLRLAGVEGTAAGQKPAPRKPQKPAPRNPAANQATPTIAQAPFEVRDSAGKTILRVQAQANAGGSRGVYVLNATGGIAAQVAVVTDGGGGRIATYTGRVPLGASSAPEYLGFMYFNGGPGFFMKTLDGRTVVVSGDGFQYAAASQNVIAAMGLDGRNMGALRLGTATGQGLVDAGALGRSGKVGTVAVAAVTGPMPTLPSIALFSRTPSFIRGKKQ
jgi:hypothetical protein